MALGHEKVGHTGQGLWHHEGMQLPAYIQHIANDLMQQRGMTESRAIQTAIGICQRWARGGRDVTAETQAKAVAAITEWNALKAKTKVSRSGPMTTDTAVRYDSDGLDASWDGDHPDLPDLTGLDVADFDAAAGGGDNGTVSRAMPAVGTGARFAKLKASLAAKGASNPGALTAYIGRKKYGKAKFTKLAVAARKAKGGVRRFSLARYCPVEDIHIMRTGEGDGTGRVVEAYAAVFDQPAGIRDGQGHYEEVIDRGAFDQWLARAQRRPGGIAGSVRVLYNHGRTMGGHEAPEFQRPLGKPLEIRPDGRGLLTRTEYKRSPLADEILDDIKEGRITAQSFEGPDIKSDPPLRGPGDRYRARGGVLPRVRRMIVGLQNYGPALFAAYQGAEFLGVRMSIPGGDDEDFALSEFEDEASPDEVLTGLPPEDGTSARYHQHALYVMRSREAREKEGITW